MSERLPIEETNLDIYGNPIISWKSVHDALTIPTGVDVPYYLGTVRPDGRPHVAGIGPSWYDGDFYLVMGLETQKAKNLAAQPACTLAARLPGFDVTMEGVATRVSDPATLEKVVAVFQDSGWPAELADDAFTAPYSAPSAGPPPWHVFRFTITSVVALKLDENGGATRWRFGAA